ncbi:hypothetical protein CL55_00006030 [Polynucleobacter duraquae]|uniref:Methyltransferase FkbM domain-containing protein n=1 Tax=Polynucleobacter duraquae TaxID=1835254 RepID=A0A0E3ZL17_9BURK|nr:FkbM family methyltransferase [Polynucleobacter duraquae]AKD24936.1 hypothetical protein CL55_00006030 [Polynucleobacter duraquae]
MKTENIPCYSPNDIDWSDEDNLVVITVAASIDDVEIQLKILGCSQSRIFYGRKDRERLGKGVHYYLTNCVVSCLAWRDTEILRQRVSKDEKLIQEVYDRLADSKSREILISRLALSLTGERYSALINYLNEFSDAVIENVNLYGDSIYTPKARPEFEYYFKQDFYNINPNEIYVDVGAEDGNTITPFLECTHDLGIRDYFVYGFEPDPAAYDLLYDKYGSAKNIHLSEYGVGESDKTIGFMPSEYRLSSRICGQVIEESEIKIKLISLDSFFENKSYSLIKLDPGGNVIPEILRGGRNTIIKYKPKMVVGAYHEIENFYLIPLQIWGLNNEYKIYLRHLAFHANETHAFGILE